VPGVDNVAPEHLLRSRGGHLLRAADHIHHRYHCGDFARALRRLSCDVRRDYQRQAHYEHERRNDSMTDIHLDIPLRMTWVGRKSSQCSRIPYASEKTDRGVWEKLSQFPPENLVKLPESGFFRHRY